MIGLKKRILTNRCLGAKTALFLWPLVLYSLIEIATNLILYPLGGHNGGSTTLSSRANHLLRQEEKDNYYYHHSYSFDDSCSSRQFSSSSHDLNRIHLQDVIQQDYSYIITDARSRRQSLPNNNKKPCSSKLKISFPTQSSLTSTEALQAKSSSSSSSLLSKAAYYNNYLLSLLKQQISNARRSIFGFSGGNGYGIGSGNGSGKRRAAGGFVLMAEASSLYEPNHDKEIIILNSTNFNTELIQHKHQFPHIKLIEYYVSFCGFCAKFKSTYIKLAKEIYPWRNVIRPSAIDLGVSSNSPIAHSWSVEVVPTLRIHPPPSPSLAEKLDKQLSKWINFEKSSNQPNDLQKSMFNEYNSSSLMIQSLGVEQYMDRVSLLKSDLLLYIERYVRNYPNELPATWPNLRPVTESSLIELRQNHPRQELFLLIEGPKQTSDIHQASGYASAGSGLDSKSDQSSSSSSLEATPSLALSIMMELSSSAPWKAIRYVRASENRALIEDVIKQQKRNSELQLQQLDNSIIEQVELLENLLQTTNQNLEGSNSNSNNIVLVHIDDSHTPPSAVSSQSTAAVFPSMTIVTGADLATLEQSVLIEQHGSYSGGSRARREATIKRRRRSLFDPKATSINKLTRERKIELLTLYINQTYSDTKEDRDFVQAISSLSNDNSKSETQPPDEIQNGSSNSGGSRSQSEKIIKFRNDSQENLSENNNNNNKIEKDQDSQQSLLTKIYNLFNPPERKQNYLQSTTTTSYSFPSDYDDKLKAIRYMLFNEIPRTIIIDKSLNEQQEKLNTLVNLVTVIKAYFPLPDASSIQFIDGVQSYLIKQQKRLSASASSGNQELRGVITNFDTRAFKQELKRLESEDKRLPEIKEWKHCRYSGYPCGVWRLFHTLVAFEYKKLSQMRQSSSSSSLPSSASSTTSLHQLDENSNLTPSLESAISMKQQSASSNAAVVAGGPQSSPVERLVSPPSTTTSLSLTIATPPRASDNNNNNFNNNNNNNSNNINKPPLTEADLPMPVLLVMRDYITSFFICEECRKKFRSETAELSYEKIRLQEPAEFSILWLWETHNRVNKRLSVDPETNPREHPKVWFPTYEQCSTCYKKPPSFLQDPNVDPVTIFHESIVWNKQEIICYLVREYTRQPMDNQANIFGYQVPFGFGYIIVTCLSCLILVVVFRCTSYYIERQRRHKATLLNGNGAHYTMELQVPNH